MWRLPGSLATFSDFCRLFFPTFLRIYFRPSPGPHLVLTWSTPGPHLVLTWSLPGSSGSNSVIRALIRPTPYDKPISETPKARKPAKPKQTEQNRKSTRKDKIIHKDQVRARRCLPGSLATFFDFFRLFPNFRKRRFPALAWCLHGPYLVLLIQIRLFVR